MQSLIVHSDAELGKQLLQMVKDYTAHECDLVASNNAALKWAGRKQNCDLLLTQLDGKGIDGFALGGSFSELFPKVQTVFFPSYSAADQRLEINDTKVFAEPIDGEKMLRTIERAAEAAEEGRDLFHGLDLLQMCCLSRKSGAIQMVFGEKIGLVYLQDGAILQAETGSANGKDALYDMATWNWVEFAYDGSVTAPVRSITRPWHEILIEAVLRGKQRKVTARN
jgi:uncharacterized protein DUF4388